VRKGLNYAPFLLIRRVYECDIGHLAFGRSQGYNANMSELTSQPPSQDALDIDSLNASIKRLSEKLSAIQDAVKNMTQSRAQLEGKIEDAQKRVQRILSRLPEQNDGRQLNLLGEAIPPTNLEDDSEPTTH
jgi:predicted  nucleic acid-binding Zn-ribbon protein